MCFYNLSFNARQRSQSFHLHFERFTFREMCGDDWRSEKTLMFFYFTKTSGHCDKKSPMYR